jgi:hypothetical protein
MVMSLLLKIKDGMACQGLQFPGRNDPFIRGE